jgi:hypothetical protein
MFFPFTSEKIMTANAKSKIVLILEDIEESAAFQRILDAIGRSTAKWLIKADLPNVRKELHEEALSDLGFQPVEIVDILYPNLGKSERRRKAKALSDRVKE